MTARRLEHGTPEGYDRGCTRHDRCPALPVHGLTCYTAHVRFASGERRYMAGYDRRTPAAAIARMLGLAPLRPSGVDAVAAEIEISRPRDVEAEIEAYAIAKAERDRAAAAAVTKTPGGGEAVDEDHLGATGAPATAVPGPTPDPTPAVCPECAAGKHGNCDGTAWDLVADELTTCSCTHTPENTPDNQEQTMPKRNTEPTSTPATKPEPPIDGSGRTKAERAEIRAWAEANGWTIGTTGRIPRDVIAAYDAAKTPGGPPAPAPKASALTEGATARFKELAKTDTVDAETPPAVDDHAATLDAPVIDADALTPNEPADDVAVAVDYVATSDTLDEVRARADMPIATADDRGVAIVTGEPAGIPVIPRPDWGLVTTSQDVEQARDLAARIEAENAILLEQNRLASALEFALRSWAAADEKLAVEHTRARGAQTIRIAANRHLLETIHQLKIDLGATITELEIHKAAARVDAKRISELTDEVNRLSARRWWQIGGGR